MLEKLSRLAEDVAINASRRQLLGRIGKGALAAAAAAGGLLALPGAAHAAPAACGQGSSRACLGRKQGDPCYAGRYVGKCKGAPVCVCIISERRNPRGVGNRGLRLRRRRDKDD